MSQSNPTDFQANAYAENYVLYGDQSKAWRVAFPDSNCKPESVNVKASKLHNVVKIQSRIAEINSKLAKQSEEEFGVTVSDIKKMLVMAVKGGLKTKTDAQGNTIMHNASATVSALSEINRMDGNHHQYKMEIDHTSSDGSMTPRELSDSQLMAIIENAGK